MTYEPPYSASGLALWAVVVVSVLAGSCVGSFLNVVIYRVPLHLPVSKPRSFCPTCQRQLRWWENVPLLSWLALRGRCHTCHEPISVRYPLVEGITALAFGLVAVAWRGVGTTIAYCLLAATLIAVLITDAGAIRSPLKVAAVGTALGDVALVAATVWNGRWTSFAGAQVGMLVGAGCFAILRRRDPECLLVAGYGRSSLIPAGLWLGGIGLVPMVSGLGVAAVAFVACLALGHPTRSPGRDRPPSPNSSGSISARVARRPLVIAVAIAVTVSLIVAI